MVEIKILKDEKAIKQAAFMGVFGTPFERTENGFIVKGRDEKKLAESITKTIHYELPESELTDTDEKFVISYGGQPAVEVLF